MNRRALVRGIQLVVLLTLASLAWVLYSSVSREQASLAEGFSRLSLGWLLVAAVLALQEGVCGGLRMWVLARVLEPKLHVRTAITSEFVLMFVAGVTPGQAGAPVSQIAVLVNGGMRIADVATAELLTASCTVSFFLLTAAGVAVLKSTGNLALDGGAGVDVLLWISTGTFGMALFGMTLAAASPRLLKLVVGVLARVVGPLYRALLRALASSRRLGPWATRQLAAEGRFVRGVERTIDDFHAGIRLFVRKGKLAYATAFLLTFGFFCSRFAVSYFILLALGVPTEPRTFVTVGPPIVQIIIVQAVLNFALYLSPTPGASGVAEAGSNALMRPWVSGAAELPYLVLWRILALFLCMFVGGLYVFRYLGTDVLEERVKKAEAEKKRLAELRDREAERAREPSTGEPGAPAEAGLESMRREG